MWSAREILVIIHILVGIMLQTEATIRVISSFDDKTAYIIEEKPILTNIDSPTNGILVIANPSNACKPLVPAPPMPFNMTLHKSKGNSSLHAVGSPYFTWVLLVSWKSMDECSLSTKADNAAAAGYSVLLFEDPSPLVDVEPEALSPLLTPVVTSPAYEYGWTEASVYGCAIDPDDWTILKNNFTSDEYYLTFEEPSSMTGWFTYFLLGILVIGAVFFTIALSYVLVQLLVLILIWIRESIVSRITQVRRDRRRRLPPSQLRKIPILQWNSDMLQDICSICLESFDVIDRVRILPVCSHVFHQVCIDPWLLKQRRKCPNCKRKIVFPEENRDSDSSSDDERTPLIRRSSSTRDNILRRESTGVSPGNSRVHQYANSQPQRGNETHENAGQHRASEVNRNVTTSNPENHQENTPGGSNQKSQFDQQASSSINSSMNTSSELASASGNDSNTTAENNNGHSGDLKGKVEQLCARMENVGRKIRKKVKVNQASKLDNDSSSDMSTGIQPVLVSVTVEPNNIADSDCEKESQVEGESRSKEKQSGSNANHYGNPINQNPESSSSHFSAGLEVKVVPENFSPSLNNTNTANPETTEGSILADPNA